MCAGSLGIPTDSMEDGNEPVRSSETKAQNVKMEQSDCFSCFVFKLCFSRRLGEKGESLAGEGGSRW